MGNTILDEPKKIKFEKLNNGEFLEIVNQEIHKVCENIDDPNFEPVSARSVTVTLTFSPDKSARRANVKCAVASKFGKRGVNDTLIYVGRESGKTVASENVPVEQKSLIFSEEKDETEAKAEAVN